MDFSLIVVLFLMTSLALVAWALVSKREVEKRKDDPNAPKSKLAEDAPNR